MSVGDQPDPLVEVTRIAMATAEIVGHLVMVAMLSDALNEMQRAAIARSLRTIAEAYEANGNDGAAASYWTAATMLQQPRSSDGNG